MGKCHVPIFINIKEEQMIMLMVVKSGGMLNVFIISIIEQQVFRVVK